MLTGPSSFLSMGGYAAYVWGSFGAFVLVLVWNLVTPALRRRSVIQQLAEGQSEKDDD
ncbi:heme exporter protein CcmD [Hydrocarboniphaga effusa]|uniref:heme exporter protein CcmD n=1 Tax=Hydrocarboniphaga effusa TaxID=243629 RepID=UPI001ED8DA31|nr:heme exporter protein CcmD [Hydrocarboniphaga effusa]